MRSRCSSAAGLNRRGAGLVAQPEVSLLLQALDRPDGAQMGVMARERIALERARDVLRSDHHPSCKSPGITSTTAHGVAPPAILTLGSAGRMEKDSSSAIVLSSGEFARWSVTIGKFAGLSLVERRAADGR
jgi:hypothetical protein